MRRRARRASRYVVWWWVAAVAAAASIVVLQSGAHASRRVVSSRLADADAWMRARDAADVDPTPEDARLLLQRYEALRERRARIGDALPGRLQERAPLAESALEAAGVPLPPRMDEGEANPDGLLVLPPREDATGVGR